jgi:probable HAF family extracellular repeat protein
MCLMFYTLTTDEASCLSELNALLQENTMLRLITLIVAIFSSSILASVQYSITDLGRGHANGINNIGQVVGYTYSTTNQTGPYHAFMYTNGSMLDFTSLGVSTGPIGSLATAINDNGQVVGYSRDDTGITEAFLYSNGIVQHLGKSMQGQAPPGAPYAQSVAFGINNNGQVVGQAYSMITTKSDAFMYSNGTMVDLGATGSSDSNAEGINASGQVVGYMHVSGAAHAFLYSNGTMVDLGVLGGSSFYQSIASGINDSGNIVGQSTFPAGGFTVRAFLYSNGSMQNLGTIGNASSAALDINNQGQIVGFLGAGTGAWLYSNGSMQDINSLIDPAVGWTLQNATSINDLGQIVGYGTNSSNQQHAFLLTPIVPEPSLLFLLFILPFARRRR